ncbi:MAG: hypothetical protein AVDCRST_MAG75-142 [uncultured Propionibacteriaceae bacterium]|uniref:Uncharacterized protein n=1 Tax=uncultured Propionibacteriaceae bacterium TaxID=257457 RepID=A0A6J4MZB4_9ACTN|nr:MAG: hypothetical protein AVDCRST_MAG75-142 [uncultured Propionibacteriaceae bacterium]
MRTTGFQPAGKGSDLAVSLPAVEGAGAVGRAGGGRVFVLAGSDTVGSDTVGSDTVGSDTVGSDTVGSDTVGSDSVGCGAAGSDVVRRGAVGFGDSRPGAGSRLATELGRLGVMLVDVVAAVGT